jgi:hypothetical protein
MDGMKWKDMIYVQQAEKTKVHFFAETKFWHCQAFLHARRHANVICKASKMLADKINRTRISNTHFEQKNFTKKAKY